MNVKPIPNALLGDKVTLILPTKNGFSETPISNVRVERSERVEGQKANAPQNITEITVWVDRVNSTWGEFPVGAKVRYDGAAFEIAEGKVYRAGVQPHHCKFKAIKIGDENK